MAVREVPLERPEGAASFVQTTDLGESDYVLELDWVARWGDDAGAWRLTLSTAAGRVLAEGRALVAASPLLARLVDPDRPAGDLFVVTTGSDPPGLDDLGGDARLLYLDGDDLEAVMAARMR